MGLVWNWMDASPFFWVVMGIFAIIILASNVKWGERKKKPGEDEGDMYDP